MNWYHSEGATKPETVDLNWSPKNVYLHRNIEQVEKEDEHGETHKVWSYDEAVISKAEYASSLAYQNQANIDFIAMMTDVDLGEV